MILRIKFIAPILILSCSSAEAQKLSKNDKITLSNLETHVRYLSADKPESGKTRTRVARDYIISELSGTGARPKGDNNGWLQTFTIDKGREIDSNTYFSVGDRRLVLNQEYFPLDFCAAGEVSGSPAIALQESGVPWFQDLKELMEGGPVTHAGLTSAIRAKAASCAKKGATALILYNTSKTPDRLAFDPHDKTAPAAIPVIYVTADAKRKYLGDESASVDIRMKIAFSERQLTGHNVVAFIDNGAPTTVVIGARYDRPEEDSSVAIGRAANDPTRDAAHDAMHDDSGDNASGVAAMIELARLLANSKLRNNNYLFLAFSAVGHAGSGYYTGHPVTDLKKVNYMIDIDMIGGLNDTTHTLTLGGYYSSPVWGQICGGIRGKKFFSLRYDSSTAPGDHAAFYRKQIPVLYFTTDRHGGYQRAPDSGRLNYPGELQVLKFIYSIIENANSRGRAAFAQK